MDDLPVDLTTSIVEINLSKLDWTLTLPDPTENPEDENDRDGEPCVEELLSSGKSTSWWGNSGEQLKNELVSST